MRVKLTAAISAALLALLVWQHLHGGVPAHHLLARADLPAISNWWGVLTLPPLAWFLLGRIGRRLHDAASSRQAVWLGFGGALLFGAALSSCFALGREDLSGYLAQSVFVLALVVAVYRAECVLGFVLGMTVVFGPVIPMIAAAVFAGAGWLIYRAPRALWGLVGSRPARS